MEIQFHEARELSFVLAVKNGISFVWRRGARGHLPPEFCTYSIRY